MPWTKEKYFCNDLYKAISINPYSSIADCPTIHEKPDCLQSHVLIAANNVVQAQDTSTNSPPKTPRETALIPAPGPRDRAFGISGPGAKHTVAWTNYNSHVPALAASRPA